MTVGLRRLYSPKPVKIGPGRGVPHEVDGTPVEAVREEWEVVDRWWAAEKLERRYFELALADGRSVVVFRSDPSGCWYRQRA
jgi:hypothetical protein